MGSMQQASASLKGVRVATLPSAESDYKPELVKGVRKITLYY